jgi:hypothetical protein
VELRYDLMKMADLERLKNLLGHYKKIPERGLTYGLTDNARSTYVDHDDEEVWEEMALLFVVKELPLILDAEALFTDWAQTHHAQHALKRVGASSLSLESSRYWLYILR